MRIKKTHFKGDYLLLMNNTDYSVLSRDFPLLRVNISLQISRPVKVLVFIILSKTPGIQIMRSSHLLTQMKLTDDR